MKLREAWEGEARNWAAWARAPEHDVYWRFGRPNLFALLPAPGRRTLDLGCGEGRVSRDLAERGHRVTSIDASPTLVRLAAEADPAGEYAVADAAALPFEDGAFDYVMCSLFAHHFRDEECVSVLREMSRVARRRVYCIDLHRHPVAYYFYTTAGRLLLRNRLVREDGALSILRGFRSAELRRLAERAGLSNSKVERRFPYRLVLSAGR